MRSRFSFFKGRVAFYAILKAMNVGPGDEVILPGFTCIVVPNAIIYLGAKPVYIDIDPATYNINSDKIEEKITARTRAIIAQHTFGIPADMDRIMEIAKRKNLYVIEDSCHAVGSKYKGKEVGTFGDASFFSSQWSKPMTTGLGGWAVVNNEQLLDNMNRIYPQFISPSVREELMLRMQYHIYSTIFKPSLFWFVQGAYRQLSRAGLAIGSSSHEELESEMPEGFAKKMADWQRRLLEKKLKEIERVNSHRRWTASLYEDLLKKRGVNTLYLLEGYDPVFLRYPVLVNNKKDILEAAKKKRIELGDWFLSPVHPNLEGWGKVGYRKGMCLNAENICEHLINLPTHTGIGNKEIEKIIDFIGNK